MKKDPMQYVDSRLKKWAKWYRHGNTYGLGFSSCSLEYRLMTEGLLIRSTAPRPLPCNEEAEEIEALITEMAKDYKDNAFALRLHYLGNFVARKRSSGRLTSRERAAAVGVCNAQYHKYVAFARHWLAGRLSAGR